jgi:hypothetical protein
VASGADGRLRIAVLWSSDELLSMACVAASAHVGLGPAQIWGA